MRFWFLITCLWAWGLTAADNPKLKIFELVPAGQTPDLKQASAWLKDARSKFYTTDLPEPVFRLSDLDFLGADRKEKLDVYFSRQASTGKRPGILFIHGGGFTGGDKAENRTSSVSADWARAGYVVVSCNYILSTKSHPAVWPQNVAECRQAVRWMREHADELGLDEKRIAVAGGSAGGYLALMVGLAPEKPELGGDPQAKFSSRVSAVLDFYGVTESNKHGKATIAKAGPDAEKLFMPATHLSATSVPVMVLHGDADTTVDINDSRQLVAAMREAKVEHQFVVVTKGVHTFDLHPKGTGWKATSVRWENGQLKEEVKTSETTELTALTLEFLQRTIGR